MSHGFLVWHVLNYYSVSVTFFAEVPQATDRLCLAIKKESSPQQLMGCQQRCYVAESSSCCNSAAQLATLQDLTGPDSSAGIIHLLQVSLNKLQ